MVLKLTQEIQMPKKAGKTASKILKTRRNISASLCNS